MPVWRRALLCVCLLFSAAVFAAVERADLLTPTERAWLAAHPDIVLGTAEDWAPHVVIGPDRQISGFIVDHLALLNQRLGTRFRIEAGPWPAVVGKAKAGGIDGLTLTAPLEEYKTHFAFTNAFLKLDDFIYLRSADLEKPNPPKKLDDLRGKRVGYLMGVLRVKRLLDERPGITSIPLATYADLGYALLEGRIDAAVGAYSLEYWRQHYSKTGFGYTQAIHETETRMVMSIRKDYPELVEILNKGLATITTDDLLPLYQRWYGESYVSKSHRFGTILDAEERAWLAEHPVIRVGIDPLWAPIEYRDGAGKAQGMSPALLSRIGASLGVRFEISALDSWPVAMKKLANKELDLLPAIAANDERRQLMQFTQPYLSIPAMIFSAADVAYLGGMSALKGKPVVVVHGEVVVDWLRREWPDIDVTVVPNTPEALKQVASGKALAFIGNLISTSYYIGQTGLTDIKVAGETPFVYQLSMAVRDDWPVFERIVQKAIHAIPENERERIYQDWISVRYEHAFDTTTLWIVVGTASLLLLLVIAERSFRLKRSNQRLRHLTAELSQVEERERRQLATQLHDSPMQKLALAQLQLSDIAPMMTLPEVSAGRVETSLTLIRQTLDELQTLQFELSPPMLYQEGLGAALEWLAGHATERDGIAFAFQTSGSLPSISKALALLFFQCTRELVYNIAKHAGATSAQIVLAVDAEQVVIVVRDNGRGFQRKPTSEARRGGFGLFSIRERLALIGGTMTVSTTPAGTAITLRAPLKWGAA